jgi:hypothetical protein
LPADLRLLHIDCPYCKTDNLLPPELVQARQRQFQLEQQHYALHLQQQERARVAQERERARKQGTQRLLLGLGIAGFVIMCLFGGCIALGIYANNEEAEAKARAQDPKLNGQAALVARLDELRAKQGCSRILIQPRTHAKESSTISLDMVKNDSCVHILGMTGASTLLSMKYEDKVALTQPLPAAAKNLDYRLCASETATYAFKIEAVPAEPFATAAIECPRTPAEGGARSGPDDATKTGKQRVQAMLDELVKAGCKNVVSQPSVVRGDRTLTVKSPNDAACYNLLTASSFSDVRLTAELRDPAGKKMPVPDPGSSLRVEYCPLKAGDYQLSLSSSTGDYYAFAGVDCSRFGPEGLKRLNRPAK